MTKVISPSPSGIDLLQRLQKDGRMGAYTLTLIAVQTLVPVPSAKSPVGGKKNHLRKKAM